MIVDNHHNATAVARRSQDLQAMLSLIFSRIHLLPLLTFSSPNYNQPLVHYPTGVSIFLSLRVAIQAAQTDR